MRSLVLAFLVVLVAISSFVPVARAQVTAEQVREAIDRGVAWMKNQQQPNGNWGEVVGYPGGMTSLCTLALLNCGVSPDDPAIKKALNYLRAIEPQKTYVVALQTMVFCRATPERDARLIRRNVKWLEDVQIRAQPYEGSWSYPGLSGDNSNSQFALLALHEADRVKDKTGVKVQDRTWRLAQAYWQKAQNSDGSWPYRWTTRGAGGEQAGSGSMTAAGITSLIIANGMVQEPDARVEGDRILCCRRADTESTHVERGIRWLERRFSVSHNPGSAGQHWLLYYLYGLERVGRMTNRRFFGEHDWYREGADYLLKMKQTDAAQLRDYWSGKDLMEANDVIATSFALLFLSKGRWPILVAKLKHGPEEDWNAHRNDIGNLTRYVETKWNRDLVWQVVDAGASIDDLIQSPVLYYCGINSPMPDSAEAQDDLAKRIRGYLDRGGFLMAEAYCGGKGFDEGFRQLMDKVFPEKEYRLKVLPPDHPIWYAEEEVPAQYLRPVLGIEYGCRTSVVYFPVDEKVVRPPLSGLWELKYGGRDVKYSEAVQGQIDAAAALGVNVLYYATGQQLRDKLAPVPGKTTATRDDIERGKLYVASLRHPGGCSAAPRALANLMEAAAENLHLRVQAESQEIAITDPALFSNHLVFMHGRSAFQLTDGERKNLRTFLQRGGILFANSICADKRFTESFRREMDLILPKDKLKPIPVSDKLLTDAFGGFDLSTVTRRDPQAREKNQPLRAMSRKVPPELEGITLEERWAVIFSPLDLSCALEKQDNVQCQGYSREDAGRIGLNVILYSLQH
jgi:hypothetical protein